MRDPSLRREDESGYQQAMLARLLDFLGRHSAWPMGLAALGAWFVLLWKMFGDVL